ncbi:glycosyltransferase [Pseudomonas sp. 102515]|uniref:nucleotide disphospho-sugar-binding domain-containing protein n=1 Tax=Pseudomonas sp. 102515 TaxID=3071568 RepID=UPI0011C2483B|nr:glycosyltransferase [Pseudomonas sp. 102515]MDQ7913504.1 glycosyltransferase [Pseudomonas sp. 102515]QED40350.1 zeaxanthin glucosyltransferase [Pseudomonas sp.]
MADTRPDAAMHVALISPPLPSHLSTHLVLGEALVALGHRVTLLHQVEVGDRALPAGIHFQALGATSHPRGSLAPLLARTASSKPWSVFGVIADMARNTELLCREGPTALRDLGVDCLIADQMEPAGGLLGEHLGLPYASLACAVPMNREPHLPLPTLPFAYPATERERQIVQGATQVFDLMMRGQGKVIQRQAQAFGLGDRRTLDDCFSPHLQLSQCLPGFDFPRRAPPPHFHEVGPLRSPVVRERRLELEIDPGRPFVFASFGTLQGGRLPLFRRIAQACRQLDVQVLIAHCGRLDAGAERRLLDDGATWVTDFAPQEAAIARADAVITHGGFNTVLDALGAGKPMLALPMVFDQPGIARRLERVGAGICLAPRLASRARLTQALGAVLADPGYRRAAERFVPITQAAGGVAAAARLVDGLARRGLARAS